MTGEKKDVKNGTQLGRTLWSCAASRTAAATCIHCNYFEYATSHSLAAIMYPALLSSHYHSNNIFDMPICRQCFLSNKLTTHYQHQQQILFSNITLIYQRPHFPRRIPVEHIILRHRVVVASSSKNLFCSSTRAPIPHISAKSGRRACHTPAGSFSPGSTIIIVTIIMK